MMLYRIWAGAIIACSMVASVWIVASIYVKSQTTRPIINSSVQLGEYMHGFTSGIFVGYPGMRLQIFVKVDNPYKTSTNSLVRVALPAEAKPTKEPYRTAYLDGVNYSSNEFSFTYGEVGGVPLQVMLEPQSTASIYFWSDLPPRINKDSLTVTIDISCRRVPDGECFTETPIQTSFAIVPKIMDHASKMNNEGYRTVLTVEGQLQTTISGGEMNKILIGKINGREVPIHVTPMGERRSVAIDRRYIPYGDSTVTITDSITSEVYDVRKEVCWSGGFCWMDFFPGDVPAH